MTKVPILTYHSIDDSGSVISTAPETFRRQMKYLREFGYHSISLNRLAVLLERHDVLPPKAVVLTFDDGFRNFYTRAFEVIKEYNFTATVFLVTDHCGKQNDWSGNPPDLPRSELLSWQEVRELAKHGIEFGSHTRTHPDLTKLSMDNVDDEIVVSKNMIADELGCETLTFAYPFGRNDLAIKQAVRANYKAACSTDLGKIGTDSDLTALKRIDAYYLANPWVFERLSSAAFDGYMSFRQRGRSLKALVAGG